MRSIALLSVFAALSAAPVLAQGEADWSTACDAGVCTLSRSVADAASGRTVATMLIVVGAPDQDIRFGAALPLGVAIDPGARLVQGETVLDARFEVCFPDGCRAMASVSSNAFDRIAAGETIDLRFFGFGEERQISVEVPLTGLTEALGKAREQLGKP